MAWYVQGILPNYVNTNNNLKFLEFVINILF